ncbi:MAG: hypothetical protein DME50_03190 [Verrucomicrobia bacterium]|nr:MAG: hypothetical protein DME85_05715 [Verrucomicrobiota bacterium]PYK67258.1 MAG: hypothetical protein DME50_03190 [Verrucomicrobiota bacterium]
MKVPLLSLALAVATFPQLDFLATERWDENLNRIRYAREKSAALCYGMSMYRPGLNPAAITMRRAAD